ETMENVKKCRNFLSTLIKLASTGSNQQRLQPRSLPALRQLTPDSAAFIQQSQLPSRLKSVSSTSPTPSPTQCPGQPAPRLTGPINRPQLQPAVSKPGQAPPLRPHGDSLRNQAPGRIVLGQQQVQLKELQPVPVRPEVPSASKLSAAALTPAQKNKLKEAGGTFKSSKYMTIHFQAGGMEDDNHEQNMMFGLSQSRARQEDPEQLRLKQKAKEMQQQELAQMRQREANLTALAAIGPRKKRKILDSPSSSAVAEGSGTGSSLSGGAGSSGSRPTRQRITRVNLRDLLFCLENERFTSHSHFLYKGFLK
ncbi:hypothetical protein INR49_021251, partial [Caranx melampygus]